MKNRIIHRLIIIIYALPLFVNAQSIKVDKEVSQQHISEPSSEQSIFLNSNPAYSKNSEWQLKKYDSLAPGGDKISIPGNGDKDEWMKAVVPGTVLTSLVENEIYPDPYYGDVNRRTKKVIPDMADAGREFYHYWYRTEFKVPKTFSNKKIWLKFHGINYKSEIWLNGQKLGNMAGMFNSKAFDVTSIVNRSGSNTLAVNVSPVDFPGQSGRKGKKRSGAKGENQNGGDGIIGKNTTMLMSVGWDFTFQDGIRDRNTGIWKEVELYATGDVVLDHPFVKTKLNLPDTTISQQTISVEAFNASNRKISGVLNAKIEETDIVVQKEISLNPNEHRKIEFTPEEYKQLIIQNPKLWWPINKGEQNLYNLYLSFEENEQISHSKKVRFGIREITTDQNTPDNSRRFLVNGHPVFIRGTNWIPEGMLKNSAKRTLAELKYTEQAGLNLIRFWAGGISESDYFFDLCDEMGFLVWSEYWMTGDTQPVVDTTLYLNNIEATVKRIRNHPSLAYHVSSNESTEIPGAEQLIRTIDPTRDYQMQSECCGVHDGSPYSYENPMQYYENTGSKRGSRIDGFNPEYGTPILPTVESLRLMMPEEDLWPINDSIWNYLDGGGFHNMTTKYKAAVNEFGPSNSIEEFAKKAQFVGAMNFRAIWEVWNENKFKYGDRFASGFLFWYHNSPVPQTAGRMYDWSLEPTAALYYSQDALEPLNTQYDYLTNTVSVYNDFRKSFSDYSVEVSIYDINSKEVWNKEVTLDIPQDGVVNDLMKIEFPDSISQVHFIKLILKDDKDKLVSDSFYWRSRDNYDGAWTISGPAISGFEDMNKLPKVNLEMESRLEGEELKVKITNPSSSLSFFTQLKLQDDKGRSISPTFYSDNFFNLLPGESKSVSLDFSMGNIPSETMKLVIDGWNVIPQTKTFQFGKSHVKYDDTRKTDWDKDFKRVEIQSSADNNIQNAYFLKSTSKKAQPLIVSLHTWSGDYSQRDEIAEISMQKNVNYIHPDFRGQNIQVNACASELALSDIDDAITYAIKNSNVDTSKIFVVGVSGGGYATLSTFMKSRYDIKKFSAWASITDLVAWYKESKIKRNKYAQNILDCTGSEEVLNIENAKQKSPLYWDTPTKKLKNSELVIYAGVYDGIQGSVPITQSINFYNKLLTDMSVSNKSKYVSDNEKLHLLEKRSSLGDFGEIGGREIFLKKSFRNVSLIIFEGNHEMLPEFAVNDLLED
ncbi:sugar-binding domain-containing protein [Gramella sp. MAR_2010_147]|uniref:glycosyl hydrolase 2 galactose-binding domain-containing protein n=1 Tax=Gramella sp. MAR_2010_147 TaxID=1250205 RepID=UPI00087DA21C|nr:sugar-binding domain-containing protein [Gramella sp. MAR_2010_147]SDS64275.1 Prolyl oligopeptidase family protein [Gramella sp. MAR_2010_147]